MTIEYLIGTQPHVDHVEPEELPRWTAEHPEAVIVHATPDRPEPGPDAGEG